MGAPASRQATPCPEPEADGVTASLSPEAVHSMVPTIPGRLAPESQILKGLLTSCKFSPGGGIIEYTKQAKKKKKQGLGWGSGE